MKTCKDCKYRKWSFWELNHSACIHPITEDEVTGKPGMACVSARIHRCKDGKLWEAKTPKVSGEFSLFGIKFVWVKK
jgi:hypothetical protein